MTALPVPPHPGAAPEEFAFPFREARAVIAALIDRPQTAAHSIAAHAAIAVLQPSSEVA